MVEGVVYMLLFLLFVWASVCAIGEIGSPSAPPFVSAIMAFCMVILAASMLWLMISSVVDETPEPVKTELCVPIE